MRAEGGWGREPLQQQQPLHLPCYIGVPVRGSPSMHPSVIRAKGRRGGTVIATARSTVGGGSGGSVTARLRLRVRSARGWREYSDSLGSALKGDTPPDAHSAIGFPHHPVIPTSVPLPRPSHSLQPCTPLSASPGTAGNRDDAGPQRPPGLTLEKAVTTKAVLLLPDAFLRTRARKL
jgi:hypothetical protein